MLYVERVIHVIRHDDRPWTANAERRLHPMQRHVLVKKWREAFFLLAIEQHLPHYLTDVKVIVTPYLESRRGTQDVGAAFPAAKAAVDGLVDAKVMEDDNPRILTFLGFNAPIFGQGNGLELEISGMLDTPNEKAPKRQQPRKRRPHNDVQRKNGGSVRSRQR